MAVTASITRREWSNSHSPLKTALSLPIHCKAWEGAVSTVDLWLCSNDWMVSSGSTRDKEWQQYRRIGSCRDRDGGYRQTEHSRYTTTLQCPPEQGAGWRAGEGYLVLFLQETGWFVLGHYRLLQLRVSRKRWEAADAGILPKEKSMKQINPSQAAVTQ